MGKEAKGVGLLDPETGKRPEDFKFPSENLDSKTPGKELDPTELKVLLVSLDSKDPALSAAAEARIIELGFPNTVVFREFNFYQDRFQGMTDRHNERGEATGISGMLDRVVDKYVSKKTDKPNRPKKVTKDYVIQEQAERENFDFERRLEAERREWDERLKSVIEALKAKRDDPEGEGKKHRILIYGLGGGMRGPYGAGQVIGLNDLGITVDIFDENDALAGASAGLDDEFFFADTEQTRKGASIYYEECTTKAFLDMKNFRQVMNIHVVGDAMREGEKKVDTEKIRNLRMQMYSVVTPLGEMEAQLVDLKSQPDMVSAVEASMNVRLLRAPGIEINGTQMEDGSFGSLPIQKLIDKFQPTDILVLPNIPFRRITELPEDTGLYDRLIKDNAGTLGMLKKFMKIESELRKMLEEFKEKQGVNIGILWPPDKGLDTIDADGDLIQTAVADTIRDTIKQFGGQQPESVNLYHSEKFRKPEPAAA